MQLVSLPTEVLIHIFSNLDWKSILRVQSVCKKIHELCSSTSLQYRLLLGIAGYEDVSNHLVSISQRLDLLKKVESSFSYANFGHKERFSLGEESISSYDLQGGFFVQGENGGGHWIGTNSTDIYQLPSSFNNTGNFGSWKLPTFERPIRDLTLDPTQDLLVLIEEDLSQGHQRISLHFKSLTTGEPHPLSSGSYLAHQTEPGMSVGLEFIIAVMGSFVGLLFSSQIYTICNWKTGKTHMKLSTTHDDEIDGFFFLDYGRVGLVRGQRSPAEIDIYKFSTSEDIPQSTELMAKYHLPFDGRLRFQRVYCRSDPAPPTTIGTSTALGSNFSYSSPPFVSRVEDRVIVMDILLQPDEDHVHSYSILIRGETLMNIPKGVKCIDGTYLIPSELWMHQTFLQPTLFSSANWACFVYGSHLVRIKAGLRCMEVTFLDFNPRLVAWAQAKGCDATPFADGCDKPYDRLILKSFKPFDRDTWREGISKGSVIATRFVTESLKVRARERFVAMLDGERLIAFYVTFIPLTNPMLRYPKKLQQSSQDGSPSHFDVYHA